MDWKDIHRTSSVLEMRVGTSIGVMVKGDFSFIFVLKIRRLVLFVVFTFFYRVYAYITWVIKSLDMEKILEY